MNNQVIGLNYEKQIKGFLMNNNKKVYLWKDIPMDVFVESKIFENYQKKLQFRKKINSDTHGVMDTGCDVYYFNESLQQWIIVQCKNYTGTITLEKLAGFYGMILATDLQGELFYTSKLSGPITLYEQKKIKYNKQEYENPNKNLKKKNVKLVPRDYQVEAYNTLIKFSRSILQLPCGMGKTLIAIMWAKRFDIIIVFSPLKAHAQQNMNRFKEQLGNEYKYILVDSDGTRDIEEIKESLDEKVVLCVTYKSHDIIEELVRNLNESYYKKIGVVIDEFHNLTCDNLMDKDDLFYKIFEKEFNFLFVSATPRTYDNENENYVDNFSITGKVEYQYEFAKSIKDGYICDYDVFVPDITVTDADNLKNVYEELKITDITTVGYDVKAHFLLRCMDENGHSKCICYCKDIDDAKNLMQSFNKIKNYHALHLYTGLIVSDTTQKQREKVLKEFSDADEKALICSVRILDECIDIPKCDSVYLTSSQTNKIRTIQRICRSNRKDSENPNKKSGIYMWMNAYDEMTELIANLKEFDSSFTNEKIKICNVRDDTKMCIIPRKNEEFVIKYLTMDNLILNISKIELWSNILQTVKNFIDVNKIKPTKESMDPTNKKFGLWISNHRNKAKYRTGIMKSEFIYTKWCEFIMDYNNYFLSKDIEWIETLDDVIKYFDVNKKKLTTQIKGVNGKKLYSWVNTQKENEINREKNILKSDILYEKWCLFKEKYKIYIMNCEEIWNHNLKKAVDYVELNNKRPSCHDKEPQIRSISTWIQHQFENAGERLQALESDTTFKKWNEFVEKFGILFKSNEEIWCDNLKKSTEYIVTNQNRPSTTSKDPEIRFLGNWICNQFNSCKKRSGLLKIEAIYDQWVDFVGKYYTYLNNENISNLKWNLNLIKVKKYIDENKVRPSRKSENEEIRKLESWIHTQQSYYKKVKCQMKLEQIYNKWSQFLNEYKMYF